MFVRHYTPNKINVKDEKGHNSDKRNPNSPKFNQVICILAPNCLQNFIILVFHLLKAYVWKGTKLHHKESEKKKKKKKKKKTTTRKKILLIFIGNEYIKFQNPSIHGSKDIRGLKSVTYKWTDRWMDGQTSPKQYALTTSSKWGQKNVPHTFNFLSTLMPFSFSTLLYEIHSSSSVSPTASCNIAHQSHHAICLTLLRIAITFCIYMYLVITYTCVLHHIPHYSMPNNLNCKISKLAIKNKSRKILLSVSGPLSTCTEPDFIIFLICSFFIVFK